MNFADCQTWETDINPPDTTPRTETLPLNPIRTTSPWERTPGQNQLQSVGVIVVRALWMHIWHRYGLHHIEQARSKTALKQPS